MKRLLTFSGTIAWIVLIGFGIDYVLKHPNLSSLLTKALAYFGGIVLIALIVWVILRVIYGKDWMLGFGKQIVIGNDLIKATDNFLGSPSRETTANLLAHLVYRFTRLGLIGLLLAMIPIWLLYQQNTLLFQQNERIEIQNELITNQNNRLDQQTYLQEAERRSSLVFLFSNVMDAIDKELKEDVEEKGKRDLSPQLIGRIIALSQRLKPYQYLDSDSLISKPLSPERGQLLVSLLGSELGTSTLDRIYEKATFEYADLKNANLGKMYLANVNLNRANLKKANLENANLNKCRLRQANLYEVNLTGSKLRQAHLDKVDLYNANLSRTDLYKADLYKADLRFANLNETDLTGADLTGADLTNSNLRQAHLNEAKSYKTNLTGADLTEADLTEADLTGADLIGADLIGADLIGTDLTGADLTGADLTGADLTRADLRSIDLTGIKRTINIINLGYEIDRMRKRPEFKNGAKVLYSEKYIKHVYRKKRTNLKGVNLSNAIIDSELYERLNLYTSDSLLGLEDILSNYRLDSIKQEGEAKYFLKEVENQ